MRWIEFPGTKLSLLIVEIPSKGDANTGPRRILVAQGVENHVSDLKRVGFVQHQSGNWVYNGHVKDGLKAISDQKSGIPGANVIDVPDVQFQAKFYRRLAPKQPSTVAQPEASITDRPVSPAMAMAGPPEGQRNLFARLSDQQSLAEAAFQQRISNARNLGVNRQNFMVLEDPSGSRFYTTGGLNIVNEEDGAPRPGLFLRAPNAEALVACADAFQRYLANGSPKTFQDLKDFASLIYGREISDSDEGLVDLVAEIEAASARNLAQQVGRSTRERFSAAQTIQEAKVYYKEFLDLHPAIALSCTPFSAVAHRILGTDIDLKEKTVFVEGASVHGIGFPFDVVTRLRPSDEGALERLKASLDQTGIDIRALLGANDPPPKHDLAVIAPEGATLDSRFERDGLLLTRPDLARVVEVLEARAPMGRSAVLLRYRGDESDSEIETLRAWLACRYALEGTVDVDDFALTGQSTGGKTRIFMVGRIRPTILNEPHEAAMRRREVADPASLWTWTSEVVANRIKIDQYHADLVALEQNGGGLRDPNAGNEFQRPYPALSRLSRSTTMVPRFLEHATKTALERLSTKYGDIDLWVGQELAMSQEQLQRVFSPEQIDAIGLGIESILSGNGFLTADMTGVGKGRFLAGMMRWAKLHGYGKIMFLTERAMNLDDIVRDLRHIESLDEFSVMILNRNARIANEDTGEIVLRSTPTEEVEAAITAGVWPEDKNLILASYSQFNRNGDTNFGPNRPKAHAYKTPEEHEQALVMWQQELMASGRVSPKSLWMRKIVDKNTFLVIDESHNAASGTSNIGDNTGYAVEHAGAVVYSSATYAKNSKAMPLYKRLLPTGFTASDIAEILQKGGNSLQEAFSEMLVRDGRMITRQHSLANCVFETITDTNRKERNVAMIDRLAPIISGMAYLSGEIEQRVQTANEAIAARFAERAGISPEDMETPVNQRRLRKLQIRSTGFGSPLHLTSRLFQMSLLADLAADQAIDALKNNQKPIITVENTVRAQMEEIFREYAEEEEAKGGTTPPKTPEFRQVLLRMLDRMTVITQRTGDRETDIDLGAQTPTELAEDWIARRLAESLPENLKSESLAEKELDADFHMKVMGALARATEEAFEESGIQNLQYENLAQANATLTRILEHGADNAVTMAGLLQQINKLLPQTPSRQIAELRRMIATFPDMPLSVIDIMRDRIEAEGQRLFANGEIDSPWTMGEITGRQFECRDGRIVRRPPVRNSEIKNAFNSGALDGLIINAAGMTGVDLHAGARFTDQRQRVMLVLQIMSDINRLIQGYGRVNRYDQVTHPIIRHLLLGMPIEHLFLARRNAQLRRLSANINSDREHAALIKGVPELLNEIGDQVCDRYAAARPDLLRRLGWSAEALKRNHDFASQIESDHGEEKAEERRSANEFLARVGTMLTGDMQEVVLREILGEFEAAVEEHNAAGTNPLKARELDGRVHLRERFVFDGAEGAEDKSVFHAPVFVQNILVEKTVEPLRSAAIASMAERSLARQGHETGEVIADRLDRNKEGYLQFFLDGRTTLDEAIAQNNSRILERLDRTNKLIETIRIVKPGAALSMTVDGIRSEGFIVDFKNSAESASSYSMKFHPSAYTIDYVLPGDAYLRTTSLASLLNDAEFSITPGLNGADYRELLRQFNTRSERAKLERRVVMTGNLWQAMTHSIEHKLGQLVQWRDENGGRHRGLLIARNKEGLEYLPVRLRLPQMALDLLRASASGQLDLKRRRDVGIKITGNSNMTSSGVVLGPHPKDKESMLVSMPSPSSPKYGGIFDDATIRALVERYEEKDERVSHRPRLVIPYNEALPFLEALMAIPVPLYVGASCRNWCQAWLTARFGANASLIQDESAPIDGEERGQVPTIDVGSPEAEPRLMMGN